MSSTDGANVMRALDALNDGRISEHEADAYLRVTHGVTLSRARRLCGHEDLQHRRRSRVVAIASIVLLLAIMIAAFSVWRPGTTGFAAYTIDTPIGADGQYVIATPLTGLRASGTLTGEGNATIWFDTDRGSLRIATITSDPGTPRTAAASYHAGDLVTIDHLPGGASVYIDDGSTATITDVPFPAPDASVELLIVDGSGGAPATMRIPLVIGDAPRTTVFSNQCDETCTIEPAINGTLTIEIDGDAVIDVHATGDTPAPNRPPAISTPFNPIVIDRTTRIDLAQHISDPDGDRLLYSSGLTDLVGATIDGDTLTLTPLHDGAIDLRIYASDLTDIAETVIPITVIAPATEPATQDNDTAATPEPPAAGEITPTQPPVQDDNATIEAANATLDCTSPDPNQRPIECLQQQPQEYFPQEDIYLEDLDRAKVAKLNAIGNLLITGEVIEHSAGNPGARDFSVGQPDRDGNVAFVAWIDSASGDLHLRGSLTEEELALVPPPGSYSIITKRSIYLAYIDPVTGDMHLRGNIIPYRRSLA